MAFGHWRWEVNVARRMLKGRCVEVNDVVLPGVTCAPKPTYQKYWQKTLTKHS
jgi:hypothetical protein